MCVALRLSENVEDFLEFVFYVGEDGFRGPGGQDILLPQPLLCTLDSHFFFIQEPLDFHDYLKVFPLVGALVGVSPAGSYLGEFRLPVP